MNQCFPIVVVCSNSPACVSISAHNNAEKTFTQTNRIHIFHLTNAITCPLVLVGEAAASPGFSTAVSPFAAVLENCAPMLSLQQRNSTDPKNEQRPLASFLNASSLRRFLFEKFTGEAIKVQSQWTKWENVRKPANWREVIKNPRFVAFAVDRVENGEISLVANKMRSPTPKYTDEWAFRAMTASALRYSQSESSHRKWARLKNEWNNGFFSDCNKYEKNNLVAATHFTFKITKLKKVDRKGNLGNYGAYRGLKYVLITHNKVIPNYWLIMIHLLGWHYCL